jgi:outer membrane protein assembly factor BamB
MLVLIAALWTYSGVTRVDAANVLVSYDQAARLGLERAWFAQAPVDPSRSRTKTWFQYFDHLYCVSDSGIVTAINAETGATEWTRQIGASGISAFGPDANMNYLGVVSGARMYLLDRATGAVEWSRELGSAPASGPALSRDYAYVALLSGRIEGYKLSEPNVQPWYYQSKGRTFLRPTTTGSVVSWPTTEGYLYVSPANDPGIRFRVETEADIVTSPAEMGQFLYIASLDGYLYCYDENTGQEQWRYSTGFPILSSPAIVGDHAYVASIEPVLHCVDANSGESIWNFAGASHFGAQGKDRVYASDKYGNILALDKTTGALVGRIDTAEDMTTLVNDQTDRIYLANDRGLVQCLREIGANEPTLYRKPTEMAAADAEAAAVEAEAAEAGAPEGDMPAEPAEGEELLDEDAEAPADDLPAEPAEGEMLDDENPFEDFE